MARLLFALAAATLGLSAWLAFPRERSAWHVCVVDTSPSVVRRRPGWARWILPRLEQEARAAQAARQELCVIAFDDALRLVYGPGPARAFDASALRLERASAESSSLLAEALALARGLAADAGAGGGRMLVFTDGVWTGADPARALVALAASGFETELVTPPAPELPDARIVALHLPRGVERGAPLAAHLRYELDPGSASGGSEALLTSTLESPDGRREASVKRTLSTGAGALTLDLGLAPAGIVQLTVRLELVGDPVPENDFATAWTRVGGALTCLAVAPPDAQPGLARWLAPGLPGVELSVAAPEELGALLPAADVVLALDLAPALLEERGVEDFVRRGGGLLVCGGAELLAVWRPEPAPTHASWLPLEPDPGALRERDVVLLVDGSGSMHGAPFESARIAALELVQHAHATDKVWLAFFTGRLEPAQLLLDPSAEREPDRVAARARAAAALFAAQSPTGPTDIAGALESLAAQRAGAGREALVLLLTDGRDQPASARDELVAVRARLTGIGAELAVFATGSQADTQLLAALLGPGEELQRIDASSGASSGLEQLFRRELERGRIDVHPGVRAAPPPPELTQELAAVLAGLIDAPSHTAVWQARTTQADAAVAWHAQSGAPVLALRRHGLGLAAVWAAEPAWSDAEVAALAPLIRALGRPGRPELGPVLSLEEGRLTLQGVPPGWPALLRAQPLAPAQPIEDGGEAVLLAPPAAGGLGLREARFTGPPSDDLGAYELSDLAGAPLARLAVIREGTGAREFGPARALVLPEGAADLPARAGRPHPAFHGVLGLGLVLLVGAAAAALRPRRAPMPAIAAAPPVAAASAARGPGR